jgi:hypothetical protein
MSSRSGLGLRTRVFRCPTLGIGDAAAWTTLAASWDQRTKQPSTGPRLDGGQSITITLDAAQAMIERARAHATSIDVPMNIAMMPSFEGWGERSRRA